MLLPLDLRLSFETTAPTGVKPCTDNRWTTNSSPAARVSIPPPGGNLCSSQARSEGSRADSRNCRGGFPVSRRPEKRILVPMQGTDLTAGDVEGDERTGSPRERRHRESDTGETAPFILLRDLPYRLCSVSRDTYGRDTFCARGRRNASASPCRNYTVLGTVQAQPEISNTRHAYASGTRHGLWTCFQTLAPRDFPIH